MVTIFKIILTIVQIRNMMEDEKTRTDDMSGGLSIPNRCTQENDLWGWC